jgi:hypothetical protein
MRIPRPTTILVGVLASLLIASPVAASSWGPIRTPSGAGILSGSRSLAVSGSVAHLVYTHAGTVVYRRSAGGGNAWANPFVLATNSATSHPGLATIAASGSRVFVLYESSVFPSGAQLWLRRSLDGGATWKSKQLIASTDQWEYGQSSIAVAGKRAYIAWTNTDSGVIDMRESADDGLTWNGPFGIAVTFFKQGNDADGRVQLAASGERAYVAWIQTGIGTNGNGIRLRRTMDGGVNWGSLRILTDDELGYAGIFTLAASGPYVLANYVRKSGSIAIARSSDSATTLSHSDLETGTSYGYSAIALSGPIARFVVARADDSGIDYRTSPDGGATWSGSSSVAKTPAGVTNLAVGAGTAGTIVAWFDQDAFIINVPVHTRLGL